MKLEMHCHTAENDIASRLSSVEMVRLYKQAHLMLDLQLLSMTGKAADFAMILL